MAVTELQKYLTDDQLAEMTGICTQTLANWRSTRLNGPAFTKMGRLVRYPREAVEQWIAENTVTPTKND